MARTFLPTATGERQDEQGWYLASGSSFSGPYGTGAIPGHLEHVSWAFRIPRPSSQHEESER